MKNSLHSLALLTLAAGVAAAQPSPAKPAPAKVPPPPAAGSGSSAGAMPVAPPPPSGPTCFEVSRDGKLWSKTPEMLCVGTGDKNVEIKLTTGMPPSPTTVATFTLDLKTRAKCIDCNKDVFALTNPENSVFNQLAITFNGKRDPKAPGTESGTVTIGKTKFFYRKK